MGKRARAKARARDRRGQQSAPAGGWRDPAEVFDELDRDPDANIRLLRADDAAVEPLRSVPGGQSAEIPVALIEPLRDSVVQQGEGTYDIRIAIATKMGLPLASLTGPNPAPGWTFGPRDNKWELTDPTGTLIARCAVSTEDSAAEPAWTAQAMTAGQILIAYGTRVGVRVPDGVPASSYDDQYRAAELRKSLVSQQACAAIVKLSQQLRAFRPT